MKDKQDFVDHLNVFARRFTWMIVAILILASVGLFVIINNSEANTQILILIGIGAGFGLFGVGVVKVMMIQASKDQEDN